MTICELIKQLEDVLAYGKNTEIVLRDGSYIYRFDDVQLDTITFKNYWNGTEEAAVIDVGKQIGTYEE